MFFQKRRKPHQGDQDYPHGVVPCGDTWTPFSADRLVKREVEEKREDKTDKVAIGQPQKFSIKMFFTFVVVCCIVLGLVIVYIQYYILRLYIYCI